MKIGYLRNLTSLIIVFISFTSIVIINNACSTKYDDYSISQEPGNYLKSLGDTIMPTYPSDDTLGIIYILNNYSYPRDAIDDDIEGRILVQLNVFSDGSFNASIFHGLREDCDDEALRVINSMPDWNPATYLGSPINYSIIIPLLLKLE